ncbi:MAG: hypothetical protein WCK05_05405 [Planctomycetota bacterium]
MVNRDFFRAGRWLPRAAAILVLILACGCETPGLRGWSGAPDDPVEARAAKVRGYMAKVIPGYAASNIQRDLELSFPESVLNPDPPRRPTYRVRFFWKDLVITFQASGPANAQQLDTLFFAGGAEVLTEREYWRLMARAASGKTVDATLQSR